MQKKCDVIICSYCKREVSEGAMACECGTWYCSAHCLVKSLHKVGINQFTFDELDRCGYCAIEKLESGVLTFPQGDKHLERLLAPHLLLRVISPSKVVKRSKKVSQNQLSLF